MIVDDFEANPGLSGFESHPSRWFKKRKGPDLNPALDAAERLAPERGQHHHVASELEVVLAVVGRRVAFGADVAVENHLVDVNVEPEVWKRFLGLELKPCPNNDSRNGPFVIFKADKFISG